MLAGWITLSSIVQKGKFATLDQIIGLACRWDCGWYLNIATHGYSVMSPVNQPGATNLAFWPAFPYAARLLSTISGLPILISGILLANIAFILCLFFFKRYFTTIGLSNSLAIFSVFLVAFSPHSFIYSVFYGDAFALLGVIGSIYFARSQRWWLSGLFAILATSSRPTGIVLIVFLIINAYERLGWYGLLKSWRDPRPFIPVVLLPAGELSVFLISYIVSGDAFAQAHSRLVGWHVGFEAPWTAITVNLSQGPESIFWTVGALLLFLSIFPLLRARLFPEFAYTLFSFALIFSSTEANGLLRYAVTVPTVFLGIALFLKDRRELRYSTLGIFASLGATVFCAWTAYSWISI